MRRRFMHGGMAGAAMGGVGYGLDDDLLEEDPFANEDMLLGDMELADMLGDGMYTSHYILLRVVYLVSC